MSEIILPREKSVLTPEKQYEAYHSQAEKTRDMLFVGAVMGMAETIADSKEFDLPDMREDESYPVYRLDGIAFDNASGAAGAIMAILKTAYRHKWNVAQEMLNWKKTYIANRIKEKINAAEKPVGTEVVE